MSGWSDTNSTPLLSLLRKMHGLAVKSLRLRASQQAVKAMTQIQMKYKPKEAKRGD